MTVVTRRKAGISYIPDQLTSANGLPYRYNGASHMGISCLKIITMVNKNYITISCLPICEFNDAIACRVNGRPFRGAKVQALVFAPITQHRMKTHSVSSVQDTEVLV